MHLQLSTVPRELPEYRMCKMTFFSVHTSNIILSFPDFCRTVQKLISEFGGDVFIKLNWSAPKDATWVAFNNNLKCSSLSQLYLLLKSSDFIAHDLTQPFSECEDDIERDNNIENVEYNLVLRQWEDINPGTEFRYHTVSKKKPSSLFCGNNYLRCTKFKNEC